MYNKHIELVKKWLDDNDSVSLKELRKSALVAHSARAVVVYTTPAGYVAWYAAENAVKGNADYAKHWVAKYEAITNVK